MQKLCFLNKDEIKTINAYLRKNGYAPFKANELKALKDDVLNVCFASDEFAVRGMILPCQNNKAVVLRSAYAFTTALIIDKNNKPISIGERFDVVSYEFEGE